LVSIQYAVNAYYGPYEEEVPAETAVEPPIETPVEAAAEVITEEVAAAEIPVADADPVVDTQPDPAPEQQE
jgi:hypothetical protein